MIEYEKRAMIEAEDKYTFRQSTQISMQTGLIGHLRADMDTDGNGFFSSWFDFREELKTDEFKAEFDEVINSLREEGDILHNRRALAKYCYCTPQSRMQEEPGYYGVRVDTEKYAYLLRLNPDRGEYNLYCYCYRRDWLDQHLKDAEKGIRFIDSHYKELFRIPDGGKVKIHYSWNEDQIRTCRYIDDYHVEIGSNLYHICEFAERMEYGGHTCEPIRDNLPERCYSVLSGSDEIIIIKRGEKGYFKTDIPVTDKDEARNIVNEYNAKLGVSKAQEEAMKDIVNDFEQGFQGWEYKFNSVSSSRGDYPFITMTAGTGTGRFAKMASITMLDVRRKGQGKKNCKKPVLFPKIVFLYDENLHGPGKPLEDVFRAGVECSSKAMYPDWLSLTGDGYVASIYKKYGRIISPMGCRAFLSPWFERGGMEPADENDKPVFVGRFNIGAVSLHLPMIYAKAQQESRDFFEVLDYYLNLIRKIHIRTYDYLGEMKASTNPLAYCEGGFLGGHLGIHDKIKPLLKSATASFGITALNELEQLADKKSLAEDGSFALKVMEYINKRVSEFKKEDGHLYAIYGTPAENLCGLQIKQFRKKYGIIENVSDREYVSNSFHCHVTEDITPIQKQDREERFWDLFNGGKIQYVRYPIDYNKGAVETLVRRAMNKGFYEGVNLSLAYCDDCGYQQLEMDVCPKCGSTNLTKIDRMNGYLSYSRVKGDTRLNAAKMAEIADRKSM